MKEKKNHWEAAAEYGDMYAVMHTRGWEVTGYDRRCLADVFFDFPFFLFGFYFLEIGVTAVATFFKSTNIILNHPMCKLI